ncbi:MAG TPA: response regulator [Geminicoccaceae bacterium]|nr:response regulator [Geminicoccaceae bacterium]
MSVPSPQRTLRVLVVEDEMLIAMNVEDVLTSLGLRTVGPAASVEKALDLVAAGGFDGALLDVNLRGKSVRPVADALAASGIPFVLVTGHGPGGIPEAHRHRPTLLKPFRDADLADGIERHLIPAA